MSLVQPDDNVFAETCFSGEKAINNTTTCGCSTYVRMMPDFHHFVAVSPFPLAVAVTVHPCRCRCRMPWLVGVDDWLASYQRNNGKIELDPISTVERLLQLFAVNGCNETEFSYAFLREQWNFTTAERRNGNRRTTTEWWKPGLTPVLSCTPAHL